MIVEDKIITSSPFGARQASLTGGRPASTPLDWPVSPVQGCGGLGYAKKPWPLRACLNGADQSNWSNYA